MIEHFLYRFSKIPNWVAWILATIVLGLVPQFLLAPSAWAAVSYIVPLLFLETLSRSPRAVGFLAAKRDTAALASALLLILLLILIGTAVGLGFLSVTASLPPNELEASHLSLVIGLILGIVFRYNISNLLLATLCSRPRLLLAILTIGYWTAGVLVYSWAYSNNVQYWYLAGLAFGILAQKGLRLLITRRISAFKRVQEIKESIPRKTLKHTAAEWEAIALLAKGRQIPSMKFKALHKHIEKCREQGEYTRALALVSSAVYRLEGDYSKSQDETKSAQPQVKDLIDAHLILLRAINLTELGEEAEADQTLSDLLATTVGSKCPLAKAFAGLRNAEKILNPSLESDLTEHLPISNIPLMDIQAALSLRGSILHSRQHSKGTPESHAEEFMGRFAEMGIPVTASLFLDILGFCLLTAGYPEEARVLLERCIESDRSFSNGYLHLGYYFLCRKQIGRGKMPHKKDLWHAEACFVAADVVERNAQSRVKRAASRMLELVRSNR